MESATEGSASASAAAPASLPLHLFVYGTLMTGYGNNRLLSSSRSLGRAHTVEAAFEMLHGGVPFVRPRAAGGIRIAGEVFCVTEAAALAAIDRLEGHPHWYCRAPVAVTLDETGALIAAESYLIESPLLNECRPVPSGDFRDVAALLARADAE